MEPATQGIQFLGRSDGVLNPSGQCCTILYMQGYPLT
jgi:hypothetical protein